jgi:hypothetical protein
MRDKYLKIWKYAIEKIKYKIMNNFLFFQKFTTWKETSLEIIQAQSNKTLSWT